MGAAATPKEMVDALGELASLPDIVQQVNQAVASPEHSLEGIGAIISADPGLSARLLKLANSALYGFSFPVDTILRALTVIGVKPLRDLIVATVVMDMFKGIPRDLLAMESFWLHSIGCGIASRILAIHNNRKNVESYYLTGLLHDVGRLTLYTVQPDTGREILERSRKEDRTLSEVERDLLGFDHCELGWELLNQWKLPEHLSLPVRHHHHPMHAEDYQEETAILHVANMIAAALMMGHSGEPCASPLVSEAWEWIGMEPAALPPLLDRMESEYHAALSALS